MTNPNVVCKDYLGIMSIHRVLLKSAILLSIILAMGRATLATTVVVPSDDDMIVGARAIVMGRVLSISTSYDESRGMVFTYVKLRVDEVLKGHLKNRKIVLKELGGVAGNHGTLFYGVPNFALDEQVLVYLDTRDDGSLRVHQMYLGKFSIIADSQTGERLVVRDNPDSHVQVLPNANPPGEATSRMELSAYAAMVRQRLAVNWNRAVEFETSHYSGVPVLSQPSEYTRKETRGELVPQFTLLDPSTPIRWFEPDTGQPVTFLVKPDGAPGGGSTILADMGAAAAAWTGVSGSNLSVAVLGSTSQCQSSQGANTLVFDNCDRSFPASTSCSGVLALGGISAYNPTVTRVVNGTTFAKAVTGHISFNPFASCFFSNRCNVQEVATHEMGHVLGFGHSNDLSATMYFQAHFDGRCGGLRADDIAGLNFIYPSGGGGGGGGGTVTINTASPLPSGTSGTAYSQLLSASGGTPPYSWGVISGSLPPGLNLSSGGAISGTPSATGTANFTVQVSDSASHIAQKGFSLTINSTGGGGGGGTTLVSQFISQNVPSTLTPGQSFNVTLTWRNVGTASWSESAGVRVGSQNPANNTTWGGNRIILPSNLVVLTGDNLQVTVTMFAPQTAGTYNFQWQMVKDNTGFFGDPSPNLTITVGSSVTVTIGGSPSYDAVRDSSFSAQLSASGGTQPYTWLVIGGVLPPGLNLNASTGLISGTPISGGIYNFTVQAMDSTAHAGTKALTINVAAPPVQIATSSLPLAVRGLAYSQQLAATGGTQPFTWSLTGAPLPSGLSLNSSGLISGTPTVTGAFTVTLSVRDQSGSTSGRSFVLTVVGPEALPQITKIKFKVGAGKLIVTGTFQLGATVLVDEVARTPRSADIETIVVKGLFLSSGNHRVRVVNPNGLSSDTRTFAIQ